jgi:hypothetical protein
MVAVLGEVIEGFQGPAVVKSVALEVTSHRRPRSMRRLQTETEASE